LIYKGNPVRGVRGKDLHLCGGPGMGNLYSQTKRDEKRAWGGKSFPSMEQGGKKKQRM